MILASLRLSGMVALLLLGVASCTLQWQREGSTASDLKADRDECLAESKNTSGVMNLYTSRYIEKCLKDRGWTRSSTGVTAAAAPVAVESAVQAQSAPGMTFDECFARCRELTDRTKEECFDTCLSLR